MRNAEPSCKKKFSKACKKKNKKIPNAILLLCCCAISPKTVTHYHTIKQQILLSVALCGRLLFEVETLAGKEINKKKTFFVCHEPTHRAHNENEQCNTHLWGSVCTGESVCVCVWLSPCTIERCVDHADLLTVVPRLLCLSPDPFVAQLHCVTN